MLRKKDLKDQPIKIAILTLKTTLYYLEQCCQLTVRNLKNFCHKVIKILNFQTRWPF